MLLFSGYFFLLAKKNRLQGVIKGIASRHDVLITRGSIPAKGYKK
jgi:hypothetical protein